MLSLLKKLGFSILTIAGNDAVVQVEKDLRL
jgi:hypothetical protein